MKPKIKSTGLQKTTSGQPQLAHEREQAWHCNPHPRLPKITFPLHSIVALHWVSRKRGRGPPTSHFVTIKSTNSTPATSIKLYSLVCAYSSHKKTTVKVGSVLGWGYRWNGRQIKSSEATACLRNSRTCGQRCQHHVWSWWFFRGNKWGRFVNIIY